MSAQQPKPSAAVIKKLRLCRELTLAIQAEAILNAFLTDTKTLHLTAQLADATNITREFGGAAKVRAGIKKQFWWREAAEVIMTAEYDAAYMKFEDVLVRIQAEEDVWGGGGNREQ